MKSVNLAGETFMRSKLPVLKSALLALGVYLLVMPAPALAAEKPAGNKIYPPYPDVWGREMPIPKDATGVVFADNVFEGPDGHILVGAWYRNRPGGEAGSRYLYDFFKGRVFKEWPAQKGPDSDIDKMYRFIEANGYRRLENVVGYYSTDRIPIPNGGHFGSADGDTIFRSSLRRFKPDGSELYRWTIFYLFDHAYYSTGRAASDIFGGRRFAYFRASAIHPKLYPLRDGTFLLAGSRRSVFIRFKGDLSSPYIRRSGNVILINPEIANKMFLESWNEAENILSRLRDRNPKQPWLAPEVTDEIMFSKLKNLINQKEGTSK